MWFNDSAFIPNLITALSLDTKKGIVNNWLPQAFVLTMPVRINQLILSFNSLGILYQAG